MSVGFYEILQVPPDASPEAIRVAYQEQIAQVVRKQRAAEARQLDMAAIEARRLALKEAWEVLSDPARRRRYDRFRDLSRQSLPADAEALWREASRSLVEPAAAVALDVIRTLTTLRVDDAPPPAAVATPLPSSGAATVEIVDAETGVDGRAVAASPRRAPEPRVARPQGAALALDRTVSAESLARLSDQYGPTGAWLRAVREARKVPIEDLSASTRITQRFLDAMERDAYHELPSATFVRGYLRMVVRALEALDGADLDDFVEGYMSRFHRARG